MLASSIKSNFHAVKNSTEGEHLEFYIASYLLDVMCTKYDFEGLGLKWSPQEELHVHIYFKGVWNTGYRQVYEKIAE